MPFAEDGRRTWGSMDQNTVETLCVPRTRDAIPRWQPADAYLAGGTWLFSEPQAEVRRLIDLTDLGWEPLVATDEALDIAATCTIATLARAKLPADWQAAPLVAFCCHALLGSFKIWNAATVGGNLCLALPAGPLIALLGALDGTCTIWTSDGGERRLPATDFVLGPQRNVLRPGEILRSVTVPTAAFRRRAAFRRISLSPNGRSGALVIGTTSPAGDIVLTVTAATPRPVRVALPPSCGALDLRAALDAAIRPVGWYDDVHGRPEWRAHVTRHLAEEIRVELAEGAAS